MVKHILQAGQTYLNPAFCLEVAWVNTPQISLSPHVVYYIHTRSCNRTGVYVTRPPPYLIFPYHFYPNHYP